MTDDHTLTFQTDSGNTVTVTATRGTLTATVDGPDIAFEDTRCRLTTSRGTDVLACGQQTTKDGDTIDAYIPTEGHKDDIKALKKNSKTDAPLTYEVEEYERSTRSDWGGGTVTQTRLSANKSRVERTDAENDLARQIDTDHDVPEDAEPGDVLAPGDILDDARTSAEREQDALEEAADTGDEVVISRTTTSCNDSSRECSTDRVARVATPAGDVETRRTHTY